MSRTKRWPGRNRSFGLPLNCTKTYKWGCSASAARQARGQLPGNGGQATDPAGAIHRLALWVGGLSTVGVMDEHPHRWHPAPLHGPVPIPRHCRTHLAAVPSPATLAAMRSLTWAPDPSVPAAATAWSRAARTSVFGSTGARRASARARSYCLSVLAVANHLPSSPGVDTMRSPRIRLVSMPGYRFAIARKVAMLVFANVAWMPGIEQT
jgi:hypothetical protein